MLLHTSPRQRHPSSSRLTPLDSTRRASVAMDGWAKTSVGASSGRAPKRQAVEIGTSSASDAANTQKLLVLVAKLGLKNAQDMRSVQATLFKTIMLPKDSPLAIEAQNAIRTYGEEAKNKAQEWPPAIYVWEAITRAALTVEGLEPAHTGNISQHRASATNPAELAQAVPHARTAKAFDKAKLKLHLAVHTSLEPVLTSVIRAAQLSGGKLMNGTAPRGGLERDVQRLLEQLGEMAMDM